MIFPRVFSRAGVTSVQDDQFRSMQIHQRRFQTGEQTVFRERIRDLQRLVRARQRSTASHQWILPIVSRQGDSGEP